jgi:hypothetical protein
MTFYSEVLRSPAMVIEQCADARAQARIARHALACILVGGVCFGAAAGAFRGWEQALAAALKLPAVTLLTLAVTGPALFAIASCFDRRWDFGTTVALMLAAGARTSLVLLALAPALGLIADSGASYPAIRLAALGGYALGGLSGLSLLIRALGDLPGRVGALLSFAVVFAAVGMQSAWLFRPYLGDPRDEHVPLFAHGRIEGGVVGALLDRRSDP